MASVTSQRIGTAITTRDGLHRPAQDWRAATVCRYFQLGSCTRGESCAFSHGTNLSREHLLTIVDGQVERAKTTQTGTASLEGSKPTCRYFQAGNCMFGDKCVYQHAGETSTDWGVTNEPSRDEPKKDDFIRPIGGAFVQFDSGARVSKVNLPSDFSAVRISGLQPNSSKQSVQDLLAENGFDVSADDVYMLNIEGNYGATIRSDDPSFSKKLCAAFQLGCDWREARIYATPIAAPMPSGHNARRVDCKKVYISWHKAVKIVWLNFSSGHSAQKVSHKVSNGSYQILGQKVTANPAIKTQPRLPRGGSTFRTRVAWTVTLTEVPAAAEKRDILQAIAQEECTHIEMGTPTYSIDTEQSSTVVSSLLTNIGPLEYWELNLETNARRVKATARFLDESDARKAAMELNNAQLPFHSKGRLTVQLVYSAKFKIGCSIYDAVQPEISTKQKAWKNISFRAYPSNDPLRRFRILKIEGESTENVVSARSDLELILAGVVAKEGDDVLWDSSLKANGKLYQAIKKLENELSVLFLRDKVKSELRIFGAKHRCEEAQQRLAELIRIESLATSARVIELEPEKFFWACHGGFKKIASRIGPEKASFDITATPKRILISGSLEDYELALAIVGGTEQFTESVKVIERSDEIAKDCSVCWTEADNPITLKCGHVYCSECFEGSCMVGDTAATNFTVVCHGDQDRCRKLVDVEDLLEHLSSAALEDMLERSFSSYIKRNSLKFRYCPTPDCGYIYRVTTIARTQNCSNCLTPTCSACHEPHNGMSCAEYQDLKSGGYAAFQKLKKELGIKDCPTCKTPLEKVAGCNHLTCAACGAHICWVCLMTFPKGPDVYEHMGKLHGGHTDVPGL